MNDFSIVWREGMFIAPQHFQQADRAQRAHAAALARLDLLGEDHGLSALEINRELLSVGKFAVRRAAGVLPDGGYFRLDRELALDVPDGTVDAVVYLAAPLAALGAAHYGPPESGRRMACRWTALRDAVDPDAEPLETEVADLGVRLTLAGSDLSGFAALPIARVLEKTADGRVALDRAFVGPVLAVAASEALLERTRETASLARVRATNAARRIAAARDAQSAGGLVAERFELQALNRSLARLQGALAAPTLSGRRLFGELAELLAALDAAAGEVVPEALSYDPNDPTAAFGALFARLRRSLTLETDASVVALDWNEELFEKRRLLRLAVPPKLLAEGRRPVLALSAPEGAAALGRTGPLACKLAGISAMPELVRRGLPGVPLDPLPAAPSELRDRADAAFFAIDTGSRHWTRFRDNREALGLHVDDRLPSVRATLFFLGGA